MNAAKQIISTALSIFTQLALFILGIFVGMKLQGHQTALLLGAVIAALIIAYNDYQEKQKDVSAEN